MIPPRADDVRRHGCNVDNARVLQAVDRRRRAGRELSHDERVNLRLDTSKLLGAPPAQRMQRPGWRDPRLWAGAAIVAVSVVGGARLLASADDTVPVWVAHGDLAAGAPVTAADLDRHRVRFTDRGDLAGYFSGADAPPDGVLLHGIGAGELVPRTAIGPSAESGRVQLPVSVDPEQVPPSVGAGSVVDVYVLGSTGARIGPSRTDDVEPALAGVGVVAAPDVQDGFVVSGKRQLVLAVPEADARRFFGLIGATDSPTVTVVGRS
jgi:hypothetical protein